MRHVQQPFPMDTIDTDMTAIPMPEDDIDALFAQLEQITPPASLITRILAQVPQEACAPTTQHPEKLLRQPELNTWVALTRQRKLL